MRIAIVAPRAAQGTWGGAERAVQGLRRAVVEHTPHDADIVEVVVDESDLIGLVHGYHQSSVLDLTGYDRVISVKYPVWLLAHPRHTVYMFHPLRGLYDTYHLFGEPEHAMPTEPETRVLAELVRRRHDRAVLPEFFQRFHEAAVALGPEHADLRFPGPLSRTIVHWLDRMALAPGAIESWFALSHTVASRPDYFPRDARPRVAPLPAGLPGQPDSGPGGGSGGGHRSGLFTASRLDGAKRIELIIDAMAHVPSPTTLTIAGTGPDESALRSRAAHDPRIRFAGFVSDEELAAAYGSAIAVPFVPFDEDQGLIVQEAFARSTPVVTCRDSGGPTEFVIDGRTGLVADPEPVSLGWALGCLVRDPGWAARLGANARDHVRRVTWAGLVRTLLGGDGHRLVDLDEAAPLPDEASSAVSPDAARPAGGAPETDRVEVSDRSTRPTVMVLATFTIEAPRHGGELRARHLYGAMAEVLDVHFIGLSDTTSVGVRTQLAPGLVQTIVPRTPDHLRVGEVVSAKALLPVTDILAGLAADQTPELGRAIAEVGAGSSTVVLAEPYLLPALHRSPIDLPFVYDAYNVEAALKADALPESPLRDRLLQTVADIERAAVTESAAVVACSATDASDLARRYDRNVAAFEVIPNGTVVRPSIATAEERAAAGRRWLDRFHDEQRDGDPGSAGRFDHLAVFFGSWHPPNLDAAELLIEIARDLPEVLFLSCGGHGEAFRRRVIPPNVVFSGNVSEGTKQRLLDSATLGLNPMRTGSGTNLKLVEYLTVGVPVVSTPFGARGVDVVDGEHLRLSSPERFASTVAEVLAEVEVDPAAVHARAVAGHQLVATAFDWTVLGHRLAEVVEEAAGTAGRRRPSGSGDGHGTH